MALSIDETSMLDAAHCAGQTPGSKLRLLVADALYPGGWQVAKLRGSERKAEYVTVGKKPPGPWGPTLMIVVATGKCPPQSDG